MKKKKLNLRKDITKNLKIGFLRQWLNEDRITDSKKKVTNAEIEFMLGLISIETMKQRKSTEQNVYKEVIETMVYNQKRDGGF